MTNPTDKLVDTRTGPISEVLLSGEDRSPEAAAERVRAFLDWKGGGLGDVGPSLNYGDLRILSDHARALTQSPEQREG